MSAEMPVAIPAWALAYLSCTCCSTHRRYVKNGKDAAAGGRLGALKTSVLARIVFFEGSRTPVSRYVEYQTVAHGITKKMCYDVEGSLSLL